MPRNGAIGAIGGSFAWMQRSPGSGYLAMASLAGLLCSMRLLLAGNAGRLVGMLSGLSGRALPASGEDGGLTIEAESAGLAVWAWTWAWAIVARSAAAASAEPSEVMKAQNFICISCAARVLTESAETCMLPFILTAENVEDSFYR